MSSVWATRYRLLLEQLEGLTDWLSGTEPPEAKVVEEQVVHPRHRRPHRGRAADPHLLPAQRQSQRLGGRHLGDTGLERQQALPGGRACPTRSC